MEFGRRIPSPVVDVNGASNARTDPTSAFGLVQWMKAVIGTTVVGLTIIVDTPRDIPIHGQLLCTIWTDALGGTYGIRYR